MFTSARINDPTEVTEADVQRLLDDGRQSVIVQFSKPGTPTALLRRVNDLCTVFRDALDVRFYGFYGEVFDGDILAEIPAVQRLTLDCLPAIRNEDRIRTLTSLSTLGFGVFHFDRPDVLSAFPMDQLRALNLGPTAKNNINLARVTMGGALEELLVCGHTRNISAIGRLPRLCSLHLTSLSRRQELGFVSDLKSLSRLELTLGGRTSFDEIRLTALESLALIRVQGLEDVGDLGRFPNLRRLQIEDQPRLTAVNLAAPRLEEISIWNCKSLKTLEGLCDLNDLHHLRLGLTGLDLEALAHSDWPRSLEVLALWSGKTRGDKDLRAVLDGRGYRQFPSTA